MTTSASRPLEVVALKSMDVVARGGFIFAVTFGLEVTAAGQFGMLALLVALFAFAFNFERQVDIQRRAAGGPSATLDRLIVDGLKLSVFNWIWMLPAYILAAALLAQVNWQMLLLASVVVVGEHLSNQGYYFALIDRRYQPMLAVVAIKNMALLGIVLLQWLFGRGGLDLPFVMVLWAAMSTTACIIMMGMFSRICRAVPPHAPPRLWSGILGQYRASLTHFQIGLVAMLMMQYDRLAVGALMPLETVGVYLRHQVLISVAYQAYSVVSFSRILPAVFAMARTEHVSRLVGRVRIEFLAIAGLVIAGYLGLWLLDLATGQVYSTRYALNLVLVGLMLTGFLLRAGADYAGLILNARLLERRVLHHQLISFTGGAVLLLGLTWTFGIWGAAAATVASQGLYLFLNRSAVRDLQE